MLSAISPRTFFRHQAIAMAEQQKHETYTPSLLLAVDQQKTVVGANSSACTSTYTSYGYSRLFTNHYSLLGFTGQPRQVLTELYYLGEGYRMYNPVSMRFMSPDNYSPFGSGGINAYAYCSGDPINYSDPTGHSGRPNRNTALKPYARQQQSRRMNTQGSSTHNQNPQAGVQGRPQANTARLMAADNVPPQPATHVRTAQAPTPNNEAPLDLSNTIEQRIRKEHHKLDNPENSAFIKQAASEIHALEKNMAPKDARNQFIGGLSVVLPQKVYKKIINQVSAIRRTQSQD